MPFNFVQTNHYQTKSFMLLLDQTLSFLTGEQHYLAKPRGLLILTGETIRSYERYLINFHGEADFTSVAEFFKVIKRDINAKIKNGDDNGELEIFKVIMSSCKDKMINNQQVIKHLEKIRLAKEVDDEDDYSPGL